MQEIDKRELALLKRQVLRRTHQAFVIKAMNSPLNDYVIVIRNDHVEQTTKEWEQQGLHYMRITPRRMENKIKEMQQKSRYRWN